MLEVLKIKNIAIIDSAEIHFKKGLNIISGETGAGKSIVIEAISLLLGSRASVELVRSGCDEAVVEGLFDISDIPWIKLRLEQAGFETATSELLVKRTVHRAGRHRISVNGELATLTILQSLCEGLIDLCSQHEHQSLIKPLIQLEILDRYGGLSEQARSFSALFSQFRSLNKERDALEKAESDRIRRADFLKFQIDEIQAAQLEASEDEKLQQEKSLLQSAEVRVQCAESIRQLIESEEDGLLQSLRIGLQKLKALKQFDENCQSMSDALERALVETEEVSIELNRYLNSIDLNSERLQVIQDRLSLLADLRRKYGPTIEGVLETLSQLEKEYASLGQVGDRLEKIAFELEKVQEDLLKQGRKLSQARKKISEVLAQSVTGELKDLKMGEARFLVDVLCREGLLEWTVSGADFVQFVVQTNRGEPARPLGKIASGGELSRLMLAIRRVISDRGGIGVYLFDEIDSGMGGQTAFQVGRKLKSVSRYNQVICITHLPQVASFGDHHLVVRKTSTGKRTTTEVIELTQTDRREELARMLAGPILTQRSIENASELLELAHKA
jgi:DNA repair protein RecN (Recombination protein N)